MDGNRLKITRDFSKLLATKQYYSKRNAALLGNPSLHRKAILQGLESEKASILLEDILRVNTSSSVTDEEKQIIERSRINRYIPEDTDYRVQS